METSVLTSKGQLLIPKRLRKKYGIEAGMKVIFEETENGIVIKPMDENFINKFVGMFKDSLPSTKEYLAMKKEESVLEEVKEKRAFSKSRTHSKSSTRK